jgi:hypothetical protein
MKKIILILTILIISIININAYTNISTCQTISSAGEYILNQSILNHGNTDCITLNALDIILDCKGLTIDGTQNIYSPYPSGISITSNFITIKNCNISDFHKGISIEGENIQIDNSSIFNTTLGLLIGSSSSNVTLSNININESSSNGIRINNAYNSTFENITISNSIIAINTAGVINNLNINNFISKKSNNYGFLISLTGRAKYLSILNSNIQSITSSLYQILGTNSYFTNNIFQNNYLGNFSSIYINASIILNNTFTQNTYLDGVVPDPSCFTGNANLTCETISPTQTSSVTVSQLPSIKTTSLIISIILIVAFLI